MKTDLERLLRLGEHNGALFMQSALLGYFKANLAEFSPQMIADVMKYVEKKVNDVKKNGVPVVEVM